MMDTKPTEHIEILEDMIGQTLYRVNDFRDARQLSMFAMNSKEFCFCDEEYGTGNDCLVELIDIAGDVEDLIGSPLTTAEIYERVAGGSEDAEWSTYSFLRVGTERGMVVFRFGGMSNGCYSETPEFMIMDTPLSEMHRDDDYMRVTARLSKVSMRSKIEDNIARKQREDMEKTPHNRLI